jgi:hypothetical protein
MIWTCAKTDHYFSGMCLEFLSAYSPDFNPIKLLFSAMKYHLHQNGGYVQLAMTELSGEDIHIILLEAIYSLTLQDIFGWFRHCGYV